MSYRYQTATATSQRTPTDYTQALAMATHFTTKRMSITQDCEVAEWDINDGQSKTGARYDFVHCKSANSRSFTSCKRF